MFCSLSLAFMFLISCRPGFDDYCFGVCDDLDDDQCSDLDEFLLGFHDFWGLHATQSASGICQGMSWAAPA